MYPSTLRYHCLLAALQRLRQIQLLLRQVHNRRLLTRIQLRQPRQYQLRQVIKQLQPRPPRYLPKLIPQLQIISPIQTVDSKLPLQAKHNRNLLIIQSLHSLHMFLLVSKLLLLQLLQIQTTNKQPLLRNQLLSNQPK
jgi:hypothetical protein